MSCSGVWFCQPFHTFCNIFLVIILKIYVKMREATAATEFTKPGDHLFPSLYTLNDSSLNGSLSWAVLISPQICASCSNLLLGEHITWYFYILICDRWISAFFLYNSSVSSANCWTLPMIKPYSIGYLFLIIRFMRRVEYYLSNLRRDWLGSGLSTRDRFPLVVNLAGNLVWHVDLMNQ